MNRSKSRRSFLKTSTLAAPYIGWKTAAHGVGPNDTVHLASFGGGGRVPAVEPLLTSPVSAVLLARKSSRSVISINGVR
ncbi:MAG: hypothetical protein ACKVJU_02835 [Verrucomicrobiales bacterium]